MESKGPSREGALANLAAELESRVQALQDNEERLRAIVSTAVDGIITINEAGTIEFANGATERLFGFSQAELIGSNVSMLMPEPYRGEHDAYLAAYLTTGNRKIIGIGREVLGRRKDGSVFPLDLAVSEVKLRQQRLFTGIVRDVSSRKDAEEALRRLASTLEQRVRERTDDLLKANEQLEGFTYSIAHDLRQYIRGVSANAGILLHDYSASLDETGRHLLRDLLRATMNLAGLADDLLEHARLGRQAPDQQDIDFTKLSVSAAEQAKERYPQARIDVQEGMRAKGDPRMIGLALMNLLDNACKFSDNGTPPRVYVGERDGVFFVRDEGIGFERQYHDKLFQAFERLHVHHAPGSGIGLANVRRVVEKHGGRIWAESPGPGNGATFHFTLAEPRSAKIRF